MLTMPPERLCLCRQLLTQYPHPFPLLENFIASLWNNSFLGDSNDIVLHNTNVALFRYNRETQNHPISLRFEKKVKNRQKYEQK
jgi:hypothetical protein